ncbi:RusA family crossover junction endodeoxyribonuclease [Neobacillus piezotolerans]|uniref:RusA family crossover junction endodeoxyribonuclease n=1 Tax=Neobacillus piezotolerans TaxID=2259171 RepID=A0A3D8GSV9_9BACI|nr:RusA family crossover junction endodeoxyribonuclease [Neobacillus piezotolerans]RDU37299.1 RusA family crossover junction endodeoxyribonuclease [Neobacillus piezotolerans]
MIPFEFIVDGPPVSQQTRNRTRLLAWKNIVKSAAEVYWPSGDSPSDQRLKISITYYYDSTSPDVDNIIKPIQDSLIGLVYIDDEQIVDTSCSKRDINGSFKVRGLSPVLAKGFSQDNEFLFIKVEEATNLEEVPR